MTDVTVTGKCLMGLTVHQGVKLTCKYIGTLLCGQSHNTCVKIQHF